MPLGNKEESHDDQGGSQQKTCREPEGRVIGLQTSPNRQPQSAEENNAKEQAGDEREEQHGKFIHRVPRESLRLPSKPSARR